MKKNEQFALPQTQRKNVKRSNIPTVKKLEAAIECLTQELSQTRRSCQTEMNIKNHLYSFIIDNGLYGLYSAYRQTNNPQAGTSVAARMAMVNEMECTQVATYQGRA